MQYNEYIVIEENKLQDSPLEACVSVRNLYTLGAIMLHCQVKHVSDGCAHLPVKLGLYGRAALPSIKSSRLCHVMYRTFLLKHSSAVCTH